MNLAAGDGAGILVAIPHLFMSEVAAKECGIDLPPLVRCRRVLGWGWLHAGAGRRRLCRLPAPARLPRGVD